MGRPIDQAVSVQTQCSCPCTLLCALSQQVVLADPCVPDESLPDNFFLRSFIIVAFQTPSIITSVCLHRSVVPILQLPEHDELLWDDGSGQPEHCLDQFPMVPKVCTYSLQHMRMYTCDLLNTTLCAGPCESTNTVLLIWLRVLVALQYEALGFLLGGLGFYFLLGQLARFNDKASKKPYVRPTSSASLANCEYLHNAWKSTRQAQLSHHPQCFSPLVHVRSISSPVVRCIDSKAAFLPTTAL